MKRTTLSFLFSLLFYYSHAQLHFDKVDSVPVIHNGNTLQFPWAGGISYPLFSEIDLNGDGLQDLFSFDMNNNRILTFINNGDTTIHCWQYAPEYAVQFPPINKWAMLYDYNGDGRADLFTLSTVSPSGIAAYRNDSTVGTTMHWTLVNSYMRAHWDTTMINIFASGVSLPAFADVDGDGDMDVLGFNSNPDGHIFYYKNNSMENYGNSNSLNDFTLTTMCYGNFALLIGGNNVVGCFHCPCRMSGPGGAQGFDDPLDYHQESAARRDDTISRICPIDIDGDGVMDLLVGDSGACNSLLVHNGGTAGAAEMDSEDIDFPSAGVPANFKEFHAYSYMDMDNDGKKDLVASSNNGENQRGIWWYKNISPNNVPDFQFRGTTFLVGDMIDVGENAAPVVVDFDGDGLNDIVIGAHVFDDDTCGIHYYMALYYYKNTGTQTNPSFQLVDTDLANISALNYTSQIYPAFGDMDGDGDQDLILGLDDGTLQYFNNSSGILTLTAPNYMGIDVGNVATPQIIDLDRDGKLDLVVGEANAVVDFYKNIGTPTAAAFMGLPTNATLGCIVRLVSGYSNGFTVPFVYDSSGDYHILVSNMAGNIFSYDHIDGNLGGCFTLEDSLYELAESSKTIFNITVSGGDFNGDGLTDLVVGEATGGVILYYQHNPSITVHEVADFRPSMLIYPNPANGLLHIRFNNLKHGETSSFKIFDRFGKILRNDVITGNTAELNTTAWQDGIYMVQVLNGGQQLTRKFTVLH